MIRFTRNPLTIHLRSSSFGGQAAANPTTSLPSIVRNDEFVRSDVVG
jgi:hypothetical protein